MLRGWRGGFQGSQDFPAVISLLAPASHARD